MKLKLATLAGVAAAYFLAAKLGLALQPANLPAPPVWPPGGLALAAVLLFGYRVWPGVALGSLLESLTGPVAPAGRLALPAASLGVALGDTLEALAGAWLVQRFARGRAAFEQPQTVFRFVALGAILSTMVSPTLRLASLSLAGLSTGQSQTSFWYTSWLGDMVSAVVVTPLLLVWSARPLASPGWKRMTEFMALQFLLVLLCQVLFGGWFARKVGRASPAFLLIPLLLWPALRLGQRGTTSTIFVLSSLAVIGTARGAGPFAVQNWTTSLLLLQEFIGVSAVMSLVLAADVSQRQQAEDQLRASEQRYRHFSNLGQRLSAARTAKEAARIIAEAAHTLFGWDAFVLDLFSPGRQAAETLLCLDTIDGRRTEVAPPFTSLGPMASQVIEQGAKLILRPTPATFPPHAAPFGDNARPSASLMYVPVRKDEKAIGVLSIQSYTPKAYSSEDLRALQALADHCGGALERIRAQAALAESDQRLQLALAASKMGIWTIELSDPRQFYGSPELEAIFGLKPGEFAGTEQAFFELIHPDDHALIRQTIEAAIRSRGDHEVEFRFRPRGRNAGWMLGRGRAYYDPAGKPVRLAGAGIDITALKEAEQEIRRLNAELERRVGERTAQLETINKELEAFSYSVSHDLRAPLRSILGFSEALLERYSHQLDPRGQDFLRRARDSCLHMDKLIADLLQLSRVGRSEMQRQPVNLSALALSIAAELRQAEPDRPADFLIAPDLRAEGDERLLRVALDNLLRNAWKFTCHKPRARIQFGAVAEPQPAFFVGDNGAGFDMAYAGKLFGVFQRLHSTSEFPGSGVGLATVQRIINRHGGRTWACGAPGQGATFYFTLPHPTPLPNETTIENPHR
ncbi:MAG: MASE1 domain-containing protein [Verrucomicrobiota bacterium]|jgi:PAS domain S-box-containing protein